MNIGKWKDVAELTALVAVVGSLIAVTVELRQTQVALQAQAYQARAFDGISWNFELARNENLRRLQLQLGSGEFDRNSLSETEIDIARHLLIITRIDLDNEHYLYQNGLLDPGFYHGETVRRIKLNAPVWRDLGMYEPRPGFRREVDRILADDSIRPSPK